MTKQKTMGLLQTVDLPDLGEREPPEPLLKPEEFLSTHELGKDGRRTVTDRDYCLRFANAEELAELRKRVEKRRAALPAWAFVICHKCGWRGKVRGALQPSTSCPVCNRGNYKKGAKLELMSKGELSDFEKAERERAVRAGKAQKETAKANAAAFRTKVARGDFQ